ncbi:MAG: hypothetical protein IKU36_08140 [Bacteroidales bacterium]|nr:hypothetical protein [Bacteroidales bacterium]
MENREQQILSEIKSMMASIRSQLERLDAKMAELQQVVDPEEFDMAPIDIDIDEDVQAEPVQIVEVQEIPLEVEEPVNELVEEPVAESVEVSVEEPDEEPIEEIADLPEELEVVEAEPEAEPEPEVDDDLPFADVPAQEEEDDDLPGVFDLPEEPVTVAAKAADAAKPILNEVLAADCAWRKDMPGSPVRDIRSAISLNDRVIFINLLFKEDAQTFVDTLAKINTMETLDQAVEYICSTFPSWDMNSDLVYRFMMAVRRKVK